MTGRPFQDAVPRSRRHHDTTFSAAKAAMDAGCAALSGHTGPPTRRATTALLATPAA